MEQNVRRTGLTLQSLLGIDLPIMEQVYRVLYEDKPALEAVYSLMVRQPKKE